MKIRQICILALIFLYAYFLRFSGLQANNPFWVDEFSTTHQAKLFIKYGPSVFIQKDFLIEHHNILTHLFVAASFILNGISVFSARIPFVIIGSLIPVFGYLFSNLFYREKTSILYSILLSTSFFQILWSVQARSYVLQQLLSFLLLIIYFTKNIKPKYKIPLLLFISLMGILTHKLFLFNLFPLIILEIIRNRHKIDSKKIVLVILSLTAIVFLLFNLGYFSTILEAFKTGFLSLNNNVWYYHSFIWRNYPHLVLFSILGLFFVFKKNKELFALMTTSSILHIIFLSFLFAHYHTKYIFPIFHYLLFFSVVGISESIEKNQILKKFKFLDILIIIFIVINGNNFNFLPEKYYSPNKEMREMSNIDYDQVYKIVNDKITSIEDVKEITVIDTWIDRPRWYLDETIKIYNFRWDNDGITKKTLFEIDSENEKFLPNSGTIPIGFISNEFDLKKTLSKYDKGFIFIDDSTLPKDVVSYVEKNFKKELYLDHYTLDENPYSIWPATLYSWGFETQNPYRTNNQTKDIPE